MILTKLLRDRERNAGLQFPIYLFVIYCYLLSHLYIIHHHLIYVINHELTLTLIPHTSHNPANQRYKSEVVIYAITFCPQQKYIDFES